MQNKTHSAARALDKMGYLMIIEDIFSHFSSKPYDVTPHLNRLNETVQMRGHNICFYAKLTEIIPNYHQITPSYLELCWSSFKSFDNYFLSCSCKKCGIH